MQNKIGLQGLYEAYLIDPQHKGPFPYHLPKEQWPLVKKLFSRKNQITRAGRVYTYRHGFNFAWIGGGTGTAATSENDISLTNEVRRFQIENLVFEVGAITAYSSIPAGTGNLIWQEFGIFLDDATASANTGTMYSRILQNYSKNLNDTVLLSYTVKETLL